MSQESPQPTSPPAEVPRGRSRAFYGWRGVARLVAVAATVLVIAECTSFAILYALALRDQAKTSPELALPAYRDQPWARTYWREHLKSSAQSYEAYPFGLWRARPFAGETLNIDEMGLRRTTDTRCDDGTPVVYVFGDSVVFGVGAPDWETLPSNLAKRFAADRRPACVVNFGGAARTSDDSVVELMMELKRPDARRPSVVLFVDSCNDVFNRFDRPEGEEQWGFRKKWLDAQPPVRQASFRYLIGMNSWALLERLVRRGAAQITPPMPADPDRVGREIMDNYRHNMETVGALAKSYGFRYAFFLLPVNVANDEPLYRAAVEKTFPLISTIANDHLHDMTGTFGVKQAEFLFDQCHLVPEGNRVLAEKVYEIIRQEVKPVP
jgi:lysophospholipase L1-like esterase